MPIFVPVSLAVVLAADTCSGHRNHYYYELYSEVMTAAPLDCSLYHILTSLMDRVSPLQEIDSVAYDYIPAALHLILEQGDKLVTQN